VFTSEELLPAIQELGTLFLIDHPGTTFQYTAKSADVLSQRVDEGVRPSVWIDRAEVLQPFTGEGVATGPAQPVGDDVMLFVVWEEYTGPRPTIEAFGSGDGPAKTGLCDAAVPCGRGAAAVLEREGITPDPDEVFEDGRTVVGRLADRTIDTSLIYRTDAARVYTKFEYLPLPDPAVGAVTYQSLSLRDAPVAQEFQSWIATSDDAAEVLVRLGLRARPGRTP
jgi:molybdate transport system substrate-binding protein